MWTWLKDAVYRADNGGMTAHYIDFNYVGVRQILSGDMESRYTKGTFRSRDHQMKEMSAACEELRKRLGKDDFIGVTNYHARRSLALVVCGWHFNRSDLENQLLELEKNGEHAKAAGWALFHNDIPRCIKSLSLGGERMKLMSTAVAGYFSHLQATAPTPGSNVWKDLCYSMAIEMEDPYLRAIFAYVSNGEWRDVLDDVGLPIKERLGIAIRFLKDDDLTGYVEELTLRVVDGGDVDGVVLTGVTEKFVCLLQHYVDRTSDVQTAAVVVSFAHPRYMIDERVMAWVESYRELLNSWGKFKARGRFDVTRGRRARKTAPAGGYGLVGGLGGQPVGQIEVQRQIAVRCNTCDRVGFIIFYPSKLPLTTPRQSPTSPNYTTPNQHPITPPLPTNPANLAPW